MCKDELIEEVEMIKTQRGKAEPVIVGFVIIVLLSSIILEPLYGQHRKSAEEIQAETTYIADLQTILEYHEVNDAKIEITEDEDRDPNIRYYDVVINSTSFEDLSENEKYRTLIELDEVDLEPTEEGVFMALTRHFVGTNDGTYRVSKEDDRLIIEKNHQE